MPTLIEVLETVQSSSVFGSEADNAYAILSAAESTQELAEIEIANPEIILRNVVDTIAYLGHRRQGDLVKVLASIPSVAVQDDFI